MNRKRSIRLIGQERALLRDQRGITGLETAIILIAFVVVASVFAFVVLSTGLFSAERGKETVHAGLKEARGSPVLKGSLIAYQGEVSDDGVSTTTATSTAVLRVAFKLTNAVGGEPIDLNPRITKTSPVDACDTDGEPATSTESCYGGDTYTTTTTHATIINYRDETQSVQDLHWEVDWLGLCQETPCDTLLEVNETALITVWVHTQTDLATTTSFHLAYVQEGEGDDEDSVHLTTLLTKKTQFIVEVVPAVGAVLTIERTTPALLDTVMNLK